MTNLPNDRQTVTLERMTYGFALKTAARLGGAFKDNDIGRQIVIVLRLPAGAALREYEAGANILVRQLDALRNFKVAFPRIGIKAGLDLQTIFEGLRRKPSLLILWPPGHALPKEIALAADRIVEVGPVRPFHLVAAAKECAGQVIDLADAEKMLEHPLNHVFAALRPKRPAVNVLSRLSETRDEAETEPTSSGPDLGELVGYGDAKAWGLSLAQDIREWREGNLAWAELDRGLLLSGPTGTGKTLFAGALARSCKANLVATSAARWQSAGYLSDTLKAMRKSFQEAVAQKPCILFLDEIDAIGDRARIGEGEHQLYWTQVINLMLELLDGHDRLEGVVVVGATNRPDAIDPALRRPGRLDRHVKISLPDALDRRHLARVYFGHHLSEADVDAISVATAGFSGADFEHSGRQVRRKARRTGQAVDLPMVMASLPASKPLSGAARKIVAVHEAGHAIVGMQLGVGELKMVAVPWEVRPPQPLGFAHFDLGEDTLWARQTLLDRIAMTLGGRAAEEEVLGMAFDGAGAAEGADLHVASDIATMLELQLGMGRGLAYFNLKSIGQRDRYRQNNHAVAARVERVLHQEMGRSREIIKRFRPAVERVAAVLVENAIIDGGEVARIMREESR